MKTFLTPEDIKELTDRIRPATQIAWLVDRGWKFEVGMSGRPKVLTAEMERHMLGSRTRKKSKVRLVHILAQSDH